MSQRDCIEYDLKFQDFKKLLVLVKNISNSDHSIQCDCFNENECHHSKNDHFMLQNLSNCNFCQFVDLLRKKHSIVKVKNDTDNSSSNVLIKYKTINYPVDLLNWTDFQEWRSPYALFCFASCTTQADLLNAIKTFEQLIKSYNKTLISSKLFIDFHLKHETNESFLLSVNEVKPFAKPKLSTSISLPAFQSYPSTSPSIDLTFQSDDNTSIINQITSTENINSDISEESNSNIKSAQSITSIESTESVLVELKEVDFNDLEKKTKLYKDDIIYLDFLYATSGIDKLIAIVETEKAKIDLIICASFNLIYNKLYFLANQIDPNNEKQFPLYSDNLKTPVERKAAETLKSTSSFISIKVINKKIVSARMAKYKADIFLTLNIMDSAFVYYTQAYNAAKKEQDLNWALSALQGLCVVSYLILKENNKLQISKKSTWSEVMGKF